MPNQLIHETSPYLLQHANNPINWLPWGAEALTKAKAENKSIFLSIGYSSSHWCQIMEKESFQDEKIAQLLNERFIAIKVDREERPDIDKYYQEIYQLINRRAGGWPISIFMTENLEPFYAASYIAPEARREEFGFEELLRTVSKKYITEYETLVEKGREILQNMNVKNKTIQATKLNLTITKNIALHAENLHDTKEGGFGKAPKFPHASTLALLLNQYLLTQEKELLDTALHSLDGMSKGGLYDPIDGGFFRFSTDEQWLLPHFEKTTYDNALLSEVYLQAYHLTKDTYYKKIAFETLDFMLSHMQQSNLFYAVSDDHRSEIEGEYTTYDYDEVVQKLTENGYSRLEITKICTTLNITKDGHFKNKNIIRMDHPKAIDWDYYDKVIMILKEIRQKKSYPFRDKRVITSWNAMMISALFKASTVNSDYRVIAIESLASLLENLYVNGTLYHSKILDTQPKVKAFLEDYAYLGEALITAYQTTLDEGYLIMATKFANCAIEEFYNHGQWKFSNGEFEIQEEIHDNRYPSSVATILSLLMSISSLVDVHYKKFVFKTLELNSYTLMRQPLSSPKLTQMVLRYIKDDIIIKSNERLLEEVVDKKELLNYPFVLLKTTLDENFVLCNSHSSFATAITFESIKPLIENRP